MSLELIVSGAGTIVAALGSGVLLSRCFRAPRGDLIAWSIALLGLLVSLGAQTLGYLSGFDANTFRAMEIGGQVIAPLALILALSEVAAKSMAVRFCARLYIPALAVVAIVILALDQLSTTVKFTKAWPDPATYYQTVPSYMLMYVLGPVTVLITIIAVVTVMIRSGKPGWIAVWPAQLIGALAALATAYPMLQQLGHYKFHVHLPITKEFTIALTAAAVLAWLAGRGTSEVRLAAMHGKPDDPDASPDAEPPGRDSGQGLYRDGGLYRPERNDRDQAAGYRGDLSDGGSRWRDERAGGYDDEWRRPDLVDNGHLREDERSRYGRADEPATGDFATGDIDWQSGGHAGGYGPLDGPRDRAAEPPDYLADYTGQHDFSGQQDEWLDDDKRALGRHSGGPGSAGDESARADLFGQIAIYTLLEGRVEEFDRLAERVVEQVRSREPDTLVFIVHAVPSAPLQRILYEVYRDRGAYKRHTQQPYVTAFEADRRPYVLATNVIELGLQQAKVSPFPSVTELFGEPGFDTSGFERPDYLRDYGRPSARPGGAREQGPRERR